MKRNLREVAAMCGGELRMADDAELTIQGVTTDSRSISENCLFIPLTGERFDGHDFAADCLVSGAGAVLWDKAKGLPPGPAVIVDDTLGALQRLAQSYLRESRARVVGITGSNGKTTTKDIVFALLSTTFKVHKTQGNFNNHIGLPLTILAMPADADIVVLEMGMSGRHEIELLSKLAEPEVAVITNIGEAHLLQLGSKLEIARAKMEILAGLKSGGLLVYDGDEPLLAEVLRESAASNPVHFNTTTFGLDPQNDDYPVELMYMDDSMVFTSSAGGDSQLHLPLLGQHNVINGLAAIAVARYFGVSEQAIKEGLSGVKLTGMRIEVVKGRSGITILNDAYNASPTAMKAAIGVLENMKGYRNKIAVLGDMLELGPTENELHREIGGYISAGKLDRLFTYGALGAKIAEGAAEHLDQESIHAYTDKAELISELLSVLHPKDVVLVKGSRGMRLEDVVEAVKSSELHQ
ncbi:UDP-N-acetylmuramoyl-tripeptide--D-alanyl-D-alanine ligase [Paenibacillus lentus]|uniref:UDP-N-acetylmuramoyl-tripeptide--D-alanyl-D-alanine ligase n=1 Tax=Paenibacillus lentus TaxID=1338368 RepID=A0A3S8S1E8_9BACL|nr:UDP-N-acetylmuramoyl-tripeptide--D-alanyl-D-alanine ligase [Paenibacillus lentus]AZK49016.1 UDP-N-acetylmuramoyl-tripeptide--D-alanyl-D-alanine ligase [Paenibacillus lentus]